MTLHEGASLVCKEWLCIIRNDPRLSSYFSTSKTLNFNEISGILLSFPVLKSIGFKTDKSQDFELEDLLSKVDFNSSPYLEEVILKGNLLKGGFAKEIFNQNGENFGSLDWFNIEEIVFNPKENHSLDYGNIHAINKISDYDSPIPENFEFSSFGKAINKNMKSLRLIVCNVEEATRYFQ